MSNNASWYFKPLSPGGTIREPIHGEFFSVDAISDPATSLIREAFQNSLDASPKSETARIRIFLSGETQLLDTRNSSNLTTVLWKHIQAHENGITRDSIPLTPFKMPYLVIEDFGTSGLTGDTNEAFKPQDSSKNHFFHFFRAEGQSDKGSSSRGSWGIGKFVFYRSSRISTILCYTIASGSFERYFMGKCILKSHYIKHIQGECYQDGYFGTMSDDIDHFVNPIQDESLLSGIIPHLNLKRKSNQSGLSVIIPWPDPEITSDAIIKAIVQDYFFPILTGDLEVEIESPEDGLKELNKDTIRELAENLSFTSSSKDLPIVIDFASEITDTAISNNYVLLKPESGQAWKWSDDMFPEALQEQMRLDYMTGKPLTVKVPVEIRKKDKKPQDSYFRVFLMRSDRDLPIRQTFIREGIIIPRVNGRKLRSTIGILYVDDEPIASFLRDAENPSHTEWQYRSTKLRGKYKSSKLDIQFVRQSITAISDFLASDENDEDREILAEYFPLESEEYTKRKRRKRSRKKGDKPEIPDIDVQAQMKSYSINELSNGFRIIANPAEIREPFIDFEVSLKAAYEIREGDPIKRHSKFDFDFSSPDSSGLSIDSHNIEILIKEINYVRFRVLSRDFWLDIRGFDSKRDLYVRVRKLSV